MNKSYIAIALLVIVILVAAVASMRSGVSSSTGAVVQATQDGSSTSAVVTYTDKGFSPSVVQVTRGASITFLNMSGRALRIAPVKSANDDTSAYLGFEATKSIGRGESFGVSVTKPGIWGYKDLNSPRTVGVVIVE